MKDDREEIQAALLFELLPRPSRTAGSRYKTAFVMYYVKL
jgi:hypothetical protein